MGHLTADGLLAVFFFLVGLELKREFVSGELRDPRKALVPVVAAIGGVIVPASLYLLITQSLGVPEAARGWAIPIATDIAFALAVLALVGTWLPLALRTFLLTLAVVDDLIGITVIAIFYTEEVVVRLEVEEENLVLEFIESSPFPEPIADAPGAPPPAVVPPEPVPLEAPLFEEHLVFHESLDMPANVGPRLADALAPSLRGKLESAVVTLMVEGVGGDVPDLFDIKSASVRRARASLRKHSVSVDEWEAPKIKAAAWLAQYVAPPHEATSVRYMADNPLRRHAFGLLRHHMLVLADARDVHDSFGNYYLRPVKDYQSRFLKNGRANTYF